jgi:hypothetical protein
MVNPFLTDKVTTGDKLTTYARQSDIAWQHYIANEYMTRSLNNLSSCEVILFEIDEII